MDTLDQGLAARLRALSAEFASNAAMLNETMGREVGEARIWKAASRRINAELENVGLLVGDPIGDRARQLLKSDPELYVRIRGPIDQFGKQVTVAHEAMDAGGCAPPVIVSDKWHRLDSAPLDGTPVWVRGWDWGKEDTTRHFGWAFFDGCWKWADRERDEATHITEWAPHVSGGVR